MAHTPGHALLPGSCPPPSCAAAREEHTGPGELCTEPVTFVQPREVRLHPSPQPHLHPPYPSSPLTAQPYFTDL